jgi:hypothetical protein
MSNIKKYKVGEIKDILESIYNDTEIRSTVVPLFMSNSGMGKTYIIEEFMKEKGVYRPPLVLSQRMPYEVSGMSLVDKEKDVMRYYDFDSLLELKDGDILFIDETYNANPLTLSAFLTFLESRIMISGKKLPNIMIVAAANPQGMPVLTPQVRRRFLQYDIEFDAKSFKDFLFKKYMLPNNISQKLCSLVTNEDFTAYNYSTSADIDKAINMIIRGMKTPYESLVTPILETLIENKTGKNVTLGNGKEIAPNEQMSWLQLIRLKCNIKSLDIDVDVSEKTVEVNNYSIVMMDKDKNIIGEIKDVATLKTMYYFYDEDITKLENGETIPPLLVLPPPNPLWFSKK